ncbi:MAG TPA: carboxymuconolactone decarboxylase family protein [Candidatus Binataceae bacterium]|jgi:4-carboxymuconolactone decarboxylase|nr:carboxymuconolactone decarboxylase family protein [Candidatus Binataceae bacterium]
MALLPYGDEGPASEETLKFLKSGRLTLNVSRMIANSNAVFKYFNQLGGALMGKAKLDPKLREIAILRTAKVSHSVYEWTQHVPMAKHVGVTDAQVAAMDKWQGAKCFNDLERKVLLFTDEVAANVKGSHEALEALKKDLKPDEIVELILTIGFWGMVARLLETTEVDLEDFAGKVNLLEANRQ